MAIAESMKGITENIITSHDVRAKALSGSMGDSRNTLRAFAES